MKNNSSIFSAGTRVTRILFLFSFCFLSLYTYAINASKYAQEKTLTVKVQNKTVKEVLDYIQSPNQKIPDRKTKCVIETHLNIKQNVIFGAK